MSTSTRRGLLRLSAGMAAAVIALSGLSVTAHAAEPEFGNIQNKNGTLLIHKHESGSQQATGTPDGKTNVGGTGVSGVVFTAYKITNLDLVNNPTDWDKVATIPVDANSCAAPSLVGYNLDGGQASTPTGPDGQTQIGNLSVGAYLLCETTTPNNVVRSAEPFIVTVPHPDAVSQGWLYEVNVYPKNTVAEAPKKTVTVNSSGVGTANQVTYTITTKIPSLGANEHFRFFSIVDNMRAQHSDISVKSLALSDTTNPDGIYTTVSTSQYGAEVDELNQWAASQTTDLAALRQLKAAPNRYLRLTIDAKVKERPWGGGDLDNQAYVVFSTVISPDAPAAPIGPQPVTPNGKGNPPGLRYPGDGTASTVPSNKVVSTWGDYVIRKYDAGQTPQDGGLAGAKFKVFEAAEPYAADCNNAQKKDDNPISINGATEFESDAGGDVTLEGLYVDKGEGVGTDEPDVANRYRCYVIQETVAPAGFALDPTPRGIAIYSGNGPDSPFDFPISNTRQAVPQLPLTGANGEVLMGLVGGALLFFAVGVFLLRRRRQEQH
ncbi:MAG: SpaH/EbpB family LPXTG-anchored major pilin [Actinomycetaceae bacterium]|nr:SpaH/EbpB family LPXTG-anchored major pilin [Actinomycetaceae bacterium]